MIKRFLLPLFIGSWLALGAYGQTAARPAEPSWEVLAVGPAYNGPGGNKRRSVEFVTAGKLLVGGQSLDWVLGGGWELVGVVNDERVGTVMYFKRRYVKSRTEREIAGVEAEERLLSPAGTGLVNLDAADEARKIESRSLEAVARLRGLLVKFETEKLKLADVWSDTVELKNPLYGAELVYDGTAELLKEGRGYSPTEADALVVGIAKKIQENGGPVVSGPLNGNARLIDRRALAPKFGRFRVYGSEIRLVITVFVRVGDKRVIVAQMFPAAKWPEAGK